MSSGNSKGAAFVTGGSRGIGRAIVLEFIRNGLDCAFTYVANRTAADETISSALAERADAKVRAYKLDVSDAEAVSRTIEQAIKDFENIGVIVNNAGVVHDNLVAMMSDEEWSTVIGTNLSGPFYVIRGFLFHLLSNHYGRIINISSLAQDGSTGQVNYAASKGGLVALSRSVAREYGSKNITCNVVTAGATETEMFRNSHGVRREAIWVQYNPMKRLASLEEISSMVYYLTTEPAGFINGEMIRVSGGLTYVT